MPDYKCPYCGNKSTSKIGIKALSELCYGRVTKAIIDALIEGFEKGNAVTIEHLIFCAWEHDPDGGPDDAKNNIHVLLHRLRKRLETDVGWTISKPGAGGRNSKYRLIQL